MSMLDIQKNAYEVFGRHAHITLTETTDDTSIARSLRYALDQYRFRLTVIPGATVRDKQGAHAHRTATVTEADGLNATLDYGDTTTRVPVIDLEVIT